MTEEILKSTCKAESCNATTATVQMYYSGGERRVECDGTHHRTYLIPAGWDGETEPFEER